MTVVLRAATAADAAAVLAMVQALARHEGESEQVRMTEAGLSDALANGHVNALLAMEDDQPLAMALWFFNFSSWTGRRGLFIEDLFVAPAARGSGLGLRLFRTLAGMAASEGCARLEWNVLSGNGTAKGFYQRLGAHHATGWETWRLEGPALTALAG